MRLPRLIGEDEKALFQRLFLEINQRVRCLPGVHLSSPDNKERLTYRVLYVNQALSMTAGFTSETRRSQFETPRTLDEAYRLFKRYPWLCAEYLSTWLVTVSVYTRDIPFDRLSTYEISVTDCLQGYVFNYNLVEFFYKGCASGYFLLPGGGPDNAPVGYNELMLLKQQNATAQVASLGAQLRSIPNLAAHYFQAAPETPQDD